MKNLYKIAGVIAVAVVAVGLYFGLGLATIGDVYAQSHSNAQFDFPMPTASGTNVRSGGNAELDYSNIRDGYVMARFTQSSTSVRVLITGPNGVRYQYNLNTDGRWETFPISGGNGSYQIVIAERIDGNRYSPMVNMSIDVVLVDEFAPFLRPNQFVNFNRNSRVVREAAEITRGSTSVLESVGLVYNWVIENIEYDWDLANAVAAGLRPGFVPDLDRTLRDGLGICFCYSALMTAMLRSQGIPTRLVIGYVGDTRHAWISVHTPEHGWINNIIFFDGVNWQLLDPTFTAIGGAEAARAVVGDGTNHRPTHIH